MINYYKKEDTLTKYYAKVDTETKKSVSIYRNKDGSRFGINIFNCYPSIYNDWVMSTPEEFIAKLDFIKI